ncbi:MAG: hypothetical protein ACI4BH_10485 [Muribaculaceae bacterium]
MVCKNARIVLSLLCSDEKVYWSYDEFITHTGLSDRELCCAIGWLGKMK